jgi:hypothetical protein
MRKEGERERGREGERERSAKRDSEREGGREGGRKGGREEEGNVGQGLVVIFVSFYAVRQCEVPPSKSPLGEVKCKAQRAATGRIQGRKTDLDMGSRRCGLFGTEGTGRAVHTPVRLLLHDFAHFLSTC